VPLRPKSLGVSTKPAPKKEAAKPAKPEIVKSAAPEPAVAMSKNVNVRGQANINSEVVTHLKRGEVVTILEEITLKSPKADEPAKWARIALPVGTPVWVSAHFVDKNTKTVTANKLRMRSGPGENYSTVGMIDKGATLNTLETKGDWANANMQVFDQHLEAAKQRYPNLQVYDWSSVVQDPWFTKDQIHYTSSGYAQRARLIADALAAQIPATS